MHFNLTPLAVLTGIVLLLPAQALGQAPAPTHSAGRMPAANSNPTLRPCTSVAVDPPTLLTLGKSRVVKLSFPAARIVVGGGAGSRAGRPAPAPVPGAPAAAGAAAPLPAAGLVNDGVADTDIALLSPTELFFLGRKTGSMNVVVQSTDGRCAVKDIIVTIDPDTLQAKLGELMPEESQIKVRGAENALVLTGSISDAIKLDQVMSLATSYGDGKKVVNLMRINTPQQVMLEVQIAEVSKTLLDKFGLDFSRMVTSANGLTSSFLSGIVGGAAGLLGRFRSDYPFGAIGGTASGSASGGSGTAGSAVGSTSTTRIINPDGTITDRITFTPSAIGKSATLLGIDAQKKDGIVRVLAEPNIMAISGQAASFLSGGKIFIPVAQSNVGLGGSTITLEEKEFGVGIKFTPTVLDGTRINLKLVSEVSELSQTGSPFTSAAGITAVLPSMTTRRVDTTVQLHDGQSFVVAGLIKNNFTEALDKFPGLGEAPVLGALFRSTEFQTDQTELMFVVTPRLVKPLNAATTLPTDNHIVPSRADVLFKGSGEGARGSSPAPAKP